MKIISTEFIGSFAKTEDCPSPPLPEYAFIGRSNVGKSSLINMLCNRNNLARISKTPGKTQTLNYYLVNKEWRLVDLPGYGYAKISQTQRQRWEEIIRNFLCKREHLQCVFLLVDARVPPQKNDLSFASWLGENRIPFVLVFTKTDKQGKVRTLLHIDRFKKEMLKAWEHLPQMFVTSAKTKAGREEMLDFIDEVNGRFSEGNGA